MPSGNKPLPQPVLTKISNTMWHHSIRPQWVKPEFMYFQGNYCRQDQCRLFIISTYLKTSNIRRIKSPNLNVSRLVLQLSLPWIHWSQVLGQEWRCSWSSADRRCSNSAWVINNSIAYNSVSYIRGLTVTFCTWLHQVSCNMAWLSWQLGYQESNPSYLPPGEAFINMDELQSQHG